MKTIFLALGMALAQTLALSVYAQAVSADDKAVRAERKQQAMDAAKAPQVGEGSPVPDAKPRASREERAAARAARKEAGLTAARTARTGEGNPIPEARAKVPRSQRVAERAERKAETARALKAGATTSKGEGSY